MNGCCGVPPPRSDDIHQGERFRSGNILEGGGSEDLLVALLAVDGTRRVGVTAALTWDSHIVAAPGELGSALGAEP